MDVKKSRSIKKRKAEDEESSDGGEDAQPSPVEQGPVKTVKKVRLNIRHMCTS